MIYRLAAALLVTILAGAVGWCAGWLLNQAVDLSTPAVVMIAAALLAGTIIAAQWNEIGDDNGEG